MMSVIAAIVITAVMTVTVIAYRIILEELLGSKYQFGPGVLTAVENWMARGFPYVHIQMCMTPQGPMEHHLCSRGNPKLHH